MMQTYIKTSLKEAREAIKNKHYQVSLKLCQDILKEDSKNYMALVFAGVSYQEIGVPAKALECFQKAIDLNPTNLLAWNGLVNYYDKLKTDDAKGELVKVYLSIIKLETIEKKIIEISEKLDSLSIYGNISEIIQTLYSVLKSERCSSSIEIAAPIVNILSKNKNESTDYAVIFEETLLILLENPKTICVRYYAEYLNLLYKLSRVSEVVAQAKKMYTLFERDSTSLRWLCKIFNETYVEKDRMTEEYETIKLYSDTLLELDNSSATAFFTQGILLYEQKEFLGAKQRLDKATRLIEGLLHPWVLSLRCYLKLFLISDAILILSKVEKLLKNSNHVNNLKEKVDLLAVEILSRSDKEEDLKRSLEFSQTVSEESKSLQEVHLIRAHINLKHTVEAELLLSESRLCEKDNVMYRLLKAQLYHMQKKYNEALNLLNLDDVSKSEWWIERGTIYWDLGQHENSLMSFLKATKLDSTNYKCFLLLGHYYKEKNDVDKARRCYEKAFKINTKCTEAGIELSRIYRQMKKWDSNLALLQAFTAGVVNKSNYWAWMQLGLHYLEQDDYEKAVANFRIVIRIDEDNMHCWESLADAYLAKGAYTSALKCYEKSSKFSGATLYPLLQMACIEQILGDYPNARTHFEEILKSNKYYVPALKGIAETCLLQAKECFRDQRLGAARDHAQMSAEYLIVAIQHRTDLACLFKLLGDSCSFVTQLPDKLCCLLLPCSFVERGEEKEEEGNKILEKNDLFVLATQCYCKSISLFSDNFLLWHDLAVCYLGHALNSETDDDYKNLILKAKAAAQHCVTKDPTYSPHWNLLGNIAINLKPPNFRLAQHSFIKSIIANPNNAIAWTNLGTLYSMLGDIKLANDSFSQAQRSDPNYVSSWIGQALLAESLAHEDAMDLFRHSTQLGMHKQGALGYAHWVCQTLKDSPIDAVIYSIHNMHAIPVACDAMIWYTEHDPFNSSAWNMLGILKERMGLNLGASEAFNNALKLSAGRQRDLTRINYGRVLSKLGKHSTAVDVFSEVNAATFNSGCGLGLALFKDKRYKESYEAYESTLHWLSDEPQYQSDILVALASMAYMFEGADTAKTLLFQSIQLENPSPWGYFATMALGLLHKDFNLAELVLSELSLLKDKKGSLQHYAILSGLMYFLQGNSKKSVSQVSAVIHRFPDEAAVWLFLCLLLIRSSDNKRQSKAAVSCARVAMDLGQSNMDVTKVLCLIALSSFLMGDMKTSLLTAQKSVFYFPNIAEGWALLGATLLNLKKISNPHIKDIFNHVKHLATSENLMLWVEKSLKLC